MNRPNENPHKADNGSIQTPGSNTNDRVLRCLACDRATPANRHHCLYCGTEVNYELASVHTFHMRESLEAWQNGFSIVVCGQAAEGIDREVSRLLSLDLSDVSAILQARRPLPIARYPNSAEAARVCSALALLGLECLIVNELDLVLEKPNIRIGSISLLGDNIDLRDFNTSTSYELELSDISLLVTGSVWSERTDEFTKKARSKVATTSESHIYTDEQMMDIYHISSMIGFRIQTAGFDFSCLNDGKALLAVQNWPRLIELLQAACTRSRLVADYDHVSKALNATFPPESRHETHGMKNTGFRKRTFGRSVEMTNLDQFNRFSRLERYLDAR